MTHVFCFMVISRLFPKEIVFRFQHDNVRHECHMVGKLRENDLLQCLGKLREFYFELGKIDIIKRNQGK